MAPAVPTKWGNPYPPEHTSPSCAKVKVATAFEATGEKNKRGYITTVQAQCLLTAAVQNMKKIALYLAKGGIGRGLLVFISVYPWLSFFLCDLCTTTS